MNELQFYLSITVVPVVTMAVVLIGVLVNNSNMINRFTEMAGTMDSRFAQINSRFAQMDSRFAEMAHTMDSRFAEDGRHDGQPLRRDDRHNRQPLQRYEREH